MADAKRDLMRFTLRRVPLDCYGYAYGGRHYYGVGLPLYWAASDDGSYDEHFRAANRDAAKDHVRKFNPSATFYS